MKLLLSLLAAEALRKVSENLYWLSWRVRCRLATSIFWLWPWKKPFKSDDGTAISQNNVLFTGQAVATEWQLDVDIKLTGTSSDYTNLLEVSQVGVVSLHIFLIALSLAGVFLELRSWDTLPSSFCSNQCSISSHLQFHRWHMEHLFQFWYDLLEWMAFTSYSSRQIFKLDPLNQRLWLVETLELSPLSANFWEISETVVLEISFNRQLENSGASHRLFYWKTHPFEFFERNDMWYVAIGMDKFSSKMACVTPQNSPIDDWISFPVKRSSSLKNWIGTHDFLMDEFSSKTVSEIPQKFANKG